jgi:hypothetical protein
MPLATGHTDLCFRSYTRNQLAFDGFLRHEAYRPTGAAFRRATAYHCNQTLFLAIVEYLGGSRSLFLIQRSIQTALLITAADVADGLCRQRNYAGNARRGDAFGQLQKRLAIRDHAIGGGRVCFRTSQ